MPEFPIIQPLEWDSAFLGFSVGRLSTAGYSTTAVESAVSQARATGMRLLYIIITPSDTATMAAMDRAGAWLADRKVTFMLPITFGSSVAPLSSAITTTTTFSPQLVALAWQSGVYSRFRLDAKFAPQVFEEMYSQWLRNSLAGTFARQVLVWQLAGRQEEGLLTLNEKDGSAIIGLLAVDALAQRQRIGQQLVTAAVAKAEEWGCTELLVATQRDNQPAYHFYEKYGFHLEHEEYIYHLWLA